MIIYMFYILKVCKSKRRNRQTNRHEWRLDIRDLQEKRVLILVRTDGRAEDRQTDSLIIGSRQQPPTPKERRAASMHKGNFPELITSHKTCPNTRYELKSYKKNP